jgi:hypothetical protein
MQSNIQTYQGGGYVFINNNTKQPINKEFRKDYKSAFRYWAKKYKGSDVLIKPVADVQFFFMSYDI